MRRGFFWSMMAASLIALPASAKDTLVIGFTQYPVTLHPNIESMAAKSYVLAMARRPFTVFDKKWELVCLLCTRVPSIENGMAKIEELEGGKKGIAVTYTIQPKANWGDGTPVTTKDVLFAYEMGRHPQSGVAAQELYRRVTRIDVKDDKTFTMHFDKLTFDYAAINDFGILPAHLERDIFLADPATYRNRTKYDSDPTNPGLWFGPYRVVEVAPGSHIVLEANRSWWGEAPAFKRIVVRAIENTAALEANLLSGSIDYIAGELGLSLDQALAFEKRHGAKYDVVYKPGLIYEHIDLNLENPLLKDRRVREALVLATDRKSVTDTLFEGKQPVAASFINGLDWINDPALQPKPYDPARATQLLDEAGWKPGADGIRQNTAGEKLNFELMTTAGNRSRELVQQVLQSQWRKVGVAVGIRNEPARVFFGETVGKRKYTGLALFAWISSPENVPRSNLHSKEIPTAENNWAGQNYTSFKNAELDDLIDRVEVELDREKRRPLWHRIQRIYAEEVPVLPLFFRADSYIVPKWLKGIEPTGHQYPTTLWIENWRSTE